MMKALDLAIGLVLSTGLLTFVQIVPSNASEDPSGGDSYWASSDSQDQSITVEISSSHGYKSDNSTSSWGSSSGSGPTVSLTTSGLAAKPEEIPDDCFASGLNELATPIEFCVTVTGPPSDSDADPATPAQQFVPPSTLSILYRGLASVRVAPAGLLVQPAGASYVGIPTIVSVGTTQQTLRTTVLGRSVRIHLVADRYSFDFGDGSSPETTTDPGAPYPNTANQHIYETVAPSRAISLTTTWSATTTNPFTGETLTVDGIVQSSETSDPFDVRDSHTAVTDLAEEDAGH